MHISFLVTGTFLVPAFVLHWKHSGKVRTASNQITEQMNDEPMFADADIGFLYYRKVLQIVLNCNIQTFLKYKRSAMEYHK